MSIVDSPIYINKLKLENRIALPPMATHKLKEGEKINDDIIKYYSDRSLQGATGLIETEYCYINGIGRAGRSQISVSEDEDIPYLKKLVEAVHQNGDSKIFAQINHAGAWAKPINENDIPLSASSITWRKDQRIPLEMSKEQIEKTIEDFTKAAIRVKKAGFDGVEIHGAHGYLLNQFYSPISNKRTDEYGGSLENRMRLPLEVLCSVRNAVGQDYPISYRFGGLDYCSGSSTIEECLSGAIMLWKNGADLLSISGGHNGYTIVGNNKPGWFSDISELIKKNVDIPVMLTGGIKKVNDAEELLTSAKADIIGVGRALMADSDWSIKALKEIKEKENSSC